MRADQQRRARQPTHLFTERRVAAGDRDGEGAPRQSTPQVATEPTHRRERAQLVRRRYVRTARALLRYVDLLLRVTAQQE
eukprot:1337387-Prymnesium_polylepis.1